MTLSSEPLKERWFLSLLILKRKVCLPQKDEKEKKKFWKFVGSYRELNPGYLGEMSDCQPLHYPDIGIRRRRVWESVFYDKNYNFTNPSLPQIEMILPIIIGPYSTHCFFYQIHIKILKQQIFTSCVLRLPAPVVTLSSNLPNHD